MFNYKGLFNKSRAKVTIAVVLLLAIASSLWFASPVPVRAVEATLPNLPAVMYTGAVYSFYAQVDINTDESIPIINLRLNITGPTPAFAVFNVDGTITSQSGHFVSITPVVSPYYGYGYLYGYGYGYQPPPTSYRYFSHWWGYGYGYGYGYGAGLATQAKYLVTLNTTGMTPGSYKAQLIVNTGPGEKMFLSPQYSFTLATAPVGGGGGPAPLPTGPITAVGSVDITPYLDAEGKTTADIILSSPDGLVTIVIPTGTRMLDAQGNPLGSIEIVVLSTPPPPAGYALVSLAYDFRPDGANFEPALSLTFTYDPADVPGGVSEEDLVLAYWDGDEWVMLATTVNTVANTATAYVAHFTPFAILARLPPAAFTVSSLTISPTEADIGQTVTISVLVANTGDVTGSYAVTLEIDEIVVATKEVTLAGGATEEVSFSVAKDVARTYVVNVNGLVGEFVVKAAPPPPPALPPAPPAPPMNWWLIGSIIAVVVIAVSGSLLWYFLVRSRQA